MILVLNCGSQSIKWKLFSEDFKREKEGAMDVLDEKNYGNLLLLELEKLSEYREKIEIIGHRFVHNGGVYKNLTVLNDDVLMDIDRFSQLAPLHNPYNILGAKTAKRVFGEAKQMAVFDTDFFSDLPDVARIYALPKELSEKYGIKRFGFHGISHEFVANEGAKKISKNINKLKIITCHLGGGSSVSAIKNGKAVDISMGFTPMEGLVMMTRSGNLDSGIVLKLVEETSVERTREILNKESGLMGICKTGEMLEVLEKIKRGDKSAKLALDMFVYSVKKYIGAYYAILGGCDLLVFTGSIGSGSSKIRNMIIKDLDMLKNTKILAIKSDEELAIAQKILNSKF